jgi:hypothetical protein
MTTTTIPISISLVGSPFLTTAFGTALESIAVAIHNKQQQQKCSHSKNENHPKQRQHEHIQSIITKYGSRPLPIYEEKKKIIQRNIQEIPFEIAKRMDLLQQQIQPPCVSVVVAIDDDDDDDNNNTDDGLELNHCLNFYHDNHSTRNTTSPRILLQQMPLESTTGTIIFP